MSHTHCQDAKNTEHFTAKCENLEYMLLFRKEKQRQSCDKTEPVSYTHLTLPTRR